MASNRIGNQTFGTQIAYGAARLNTAPPDNKEHYLEINGGAGTIRLFSLPDITGRKGIKGTNANGGFINYITINQDNYIDYITPIVNTVIVDMNRLLPDTLALSISAARVINAPVVAINDTTIAISSGTLVAIQMLAPNLEAGGKYGINLGVDLSTNNTIVFNFAFAGNNNNGNCAELGFYANEALLRLYINERFVIKADTYAAANQTYHLGTSTVLWEDVYAHNLIGTNLITHDEDTNYYSDLILGNNLNKTIANAHAEGRVIIYSSATAAHIIMGTATIDEYTHYLPNETGWIAIGGNGIDTGVGSSLQPIYLTSTGVLVATTSSVGDGYTPMYLNAGTLTEVAVVQHCAFTIAAENTSVELTKDAYKSNSYVLTIVVTSGESYLNGPLSWTSAEGIITISTPVAVSGDVSGYILTARGVAL